MEKIFNLTSTFKALDEDDGSVHICGMASTHDEDRANDVIMAEAWTKGGLRNFERTLLFFSIMIIISLLVEPQDLKSLIMDLN